MSDAALRVLDGTNLTALDLSLPDPHLNLTGAHILDIAHSRVSSSLFGLPLPQSITASALARIAIHDVHAFLSSHFPKEKASHILRHYIAAIAHQLKGDPLVVSILDGNTLRLFLEDEDDFAMLAENLFTDLDVEDNGKISKSEVRNALVQMGVEMGVPPFSEFPQLNDILRKHGADGEEQLGQAQFAQLLQVVLQDLAEELSQKNVVFIQNIKIINGSKLRQLLANDMELNNIAEKVMQEKQDGLGSREIIRSFLERNAKELGLPLSEADEAVVLLYDDVFADVPKEEYGAESDKDKLVELLKDILQKFAEQLESNPVFQDFA
ncbi:calcium ion binding protein [Senna tora]|uniref:Calcium ion binding protein n=1 Tax=Senna tora TaxID=362788 RepID=A0A834WCS9_9FABA|nr:calcium ion binding protein [Senna tora]